MNKLNLKGKCPAPNISIKNERDMIIDSKKQAAGLKALSHKSYQLPEFKMKNSLSRLSRKKPRKTTAKRPNEKNTDNIMTLQEIIFRQKLDKFIKNMRNHSGLNDMSKLNAEKLMIINDKGADAQIILREKVFNERSKRVLVKDKKNSTGKLSIHIKYFKILQHLANEYKTASKYWFKFIYGFLHEKIPLIKPFGTFKIVWEVIMLILTVWNLTSFSLTLSFGIRLQEGFSLSIPFLNSEKYFSRFQNICLLVFTCDIIIKFNSSIYRYGEPVLDRRRILKNYLSGGLLFDLASMIPFWYSLINDSSEEGTKTYFLLILKFYTLQIFFRNINDALLNKEGKVEAVYQMFKLIVTFLTVCHIFACIWHYQAFSDFESQKNWIISQRLLDASWTERYLRSLYFTIVTMTTVGYGDISPSNSLEYLVAMSCMLIGSGLIGYSINSIGAILKKKNKAEIKFRAKMQLLNSYLKKNDIENNMKIRVRKYLEYAWRLHDSFNEKKCEEMLKELPKSLKQDLLTQSRMWAFKNSFGGKFSESTISKMVNNFEICTFSKEEWIFREGEFSLDSSLFVIAKGKVDLLLKEDNKSCNEFIKLSTKVAGDMVGLISFILDSPRKCSAKADSICTLFRLSKSKFLEILKENSDEYETYCFIRDRMFLHNDFSVIGKKCEACGDVDHGMLYCPHLTYKPFKNIIIRRSLYSKLQKRRKFIREPKSKMNQTNTLIMLEKNQRALFDFHTNNLFEISALQEFYSNQNDNPQMTSPAQIFNDLRFTSDDCFTETRGRDDSKEGMLTIKEESSFLEDNLKNLYENVPFKNNSSGLEEMLRDKSLLSPLREPVTSPKQEEKNIARVKRNHLYFFPHLTPENSPRNNQQEESKYEEALKLFRESNTPVSMISMPGSHQESVFAQWKSRDEQRGDLKFPTGTYLGPLNSKSSLLNKRDTKVIVSDPGAKEEYYEMTLRSLRMNNSSRSAKKQFPMFYMDMDTGLDFYTYLPHNNKHIVIEKLKKNK